MIKAKQGNTIIIGLTERNIELLRAGKPIMFNLKEIGMQDQNVFIYSGKDEQTMLHDMRAKIHPFLTTIVDKRGITGNPN